MSVLRFSSTSSLECFLSALCESSSELCAQELCIFLWNVYVQEITLFYMSTYDGLGHSHRNLFSLLCFGDGFAAVLYLAYSADSFSPS